MRKLYLLFKRIWVEIFGILLVPILSYATGNEYKEKEQMLGFFKLGETINKVEEKLGGIGEIHEGAMYGLCSKDQWSFLIDKHDKVFKGISYMEINIQDDYNYPKTSRGITIGSRLKEVEQVYKLPEKTLSGRSWFVLRNSELSKIYVYLSKGLWIMFINQRPYSDIGDWRVVDIAVGDITESRCIGAGTHSTWLITQDKKDNIIRSYEKKYDKQKDLEIYDDYILNREIGFFEYIKSRGEYKVTILAILPKGQDKELLSELFNANSKLWENIQIQAKKQTESKYGISPKLVERIIKRVEHFKSDSAYEEIVELD